MIEGTTKLVDFLRSLPREQLLDLLTRSLGERVGLHVESAFPVTQSAFDRLTAEDIEKIEEGIAARFGGAVLAEVRNYEKDNLPHYRREILRYGCTTDSELMRKKTGMTNANPPPNIHSMMRNEIFAGDLYHGDMVAAAASRAGTRFEDGRNYLDFGCSSGALVRNLAAAFPGAHWHGCDPQAEAIGWAAPQFPEVALIRSNQEPGLPYADGYFRGVYAVSIWSHFSEPAALSWFDELHRIIEQGGFLIFTTQGYRSVVRELRGGGTLELFARIAACLIEDHYAFYGAWDDPSQEYGLRVTDWGMAFFTVEWVIRKLFDKFRIADYRPGLSQTNQDVYALTRI
jgi:SAM-dependent methyltransferase